MWKEIWITKIKPNITTIVIYVIVILIVLYAFKSEYQDQNCSDSSGKICGPGKGRAYYANHPTPNDDREDLVKKLNRTAKYDLIAVHWRIAMIVAAIVSFVALYMIQRKFPSAKDYAILTITLFLGIYAGMMQFQSGVVKPATDQADKITRQLLE